MTARRRLLLAALAVPLARPFGAVAQRDKAHRIGLLLPSTAQRGRMEHFLRGLRELGYVEGANLTVERRYAEGRDDRYPALAAELVKVPVDVLIAAGELPVQTPTKYELILNQRAASALGFAFPNALQLAADGIIR